MIEFSPALIFSFIMLLVLVAISFLPDRFWIDLYKKI
jgi:hypothetical protein